MKKIIFGIATYVLISSQLFAQDEIDALRYGYTTNSGTARGMSIGGALGSIGADFSTLSVNPAGIGLYRSSEFSLTPSFSTTTNNTTYLSNSMSDRSSKFNMGSFGMVLTDSKKGAAQRRSGWKSISFGIGMNRIATFKNNYTYSGDNYKSSLIERYAEEYNRLGGLNGSTLGQVSYPAYAAYQTYLVDYGSGSDSLMAHSYVPYQDGINQKKNVSERGHMQEYVISVGGNYKERLMLGATLGITSLDYSRKMVYSEDDISGNSNNDFQYFDFQENLSTSGTGVNLKLGAIFKASKNFRFGMAFHTPTHFELNDNSQIFMDSHTENLLINSGVSSNPVSSYTQDSILVFNYGYNTPFKAIGSATVLFNKSGFLTADVEYVDYASMRYNFRDFDNAETAVNNLIKNTYQGAINVRIGAEAKLSNLSLRGGFAYYGSPYKNTTTNASLTQISGGVGYRAATWFLDLGFQYTLKSVSEMPYQLTRVNADVQAATINKNTGNAMLTLGWKF